VEQLSTVHMQREQWRRGAEEEKGREADLRGDSRWQNAAAGGSGGGGCSVSNQRFLLFSPMFICVSSSFASVLPLFYFFFYSCR
jgi:hypothetical protein